MIPTNRSVGGNIAAWPPNDDGTNRGYRYQLCKKRNRI